MYEEHEVEAILEYGQNDEDILNLSDSLGSLLNDEDELDDANAQYPSDEDELLGIDTKPLVSPQKHEKKSDNKEDPPPPLAITNNNGNNNHNENMIVQPSSASPDPVNVRHSITTNNTMKPSKYSGDSNKDFDFPPSKIIKLTDTGRYNHVKPLRVTSKQTWKESSHLKTETFSSVSPWRKTDCLANPDSSSQVLEESIKQPSKPVKSIKSRLQLSNRIADLKYQPRTEFRIGTTPSSGTHVNKPTDTPSSMFSKRAFNFSARSSFGVAMAQLKSNHGPSSSDTTAPGFHLSHLQTKSMTPMSTVATATDKFTLSHLK